MRSTCNPAHASGWLVATAPEAPTGMRLVAYGYWLWSTGAHAFNGDPPAGRTRYFNGFAHHPVDCLMHNTGASSIHGRTKTSCVTASRSRGFKQAG